jgi:hypothetical protein
MWIRIHWDPKLHQKVRHTGTRTKLYTTEHELTSFYILKKLHCYNEFAVAKELLGCTGIYILKNTPRGGISANFIWGKKY